MSDEAEFSINVSARADISPIREVSSAISELTEKERLRNEAAASGGDTAELRRQVALTKEVALHTELEAIQERASGNTAEADKLDREVEILRRQAQLQVQLNVTSREAGLLAAQELAAKERLLLVEEERVAAAQAQQAAEAGSAATGGLRAEVTGLGAGVRGARMESMALSALLNGDLTNGMLILTEATRGLSMAMRANPIGLIVGGVAAAIAVYEHFGMATKKATEETKKHNEELAKDAEQFNKISNAAKAAETAIKAIGDIFSGGVKDVAAWTEEMDKGTAAALKMEKALIKLALARGEISPEEAAEKEAAASRKAERANIEAAKTKEQLDKEGAERTLDKLDDTEAGEKDRKDQARETVEQRRQSAIKSLGITDRPTTLTEPKDVEHMLEKGKNTDAQKAALLELEQAMHNAEKAEREYAETVKKTEEERKKARSQIQTSEKNLGDLGGRSALVDVEEQTDQAEAEKRKALKANEEKKKFAEADLDQAVAENEDRDKSTQAYRDGLQKIEQKKEAIRLLDDSKRTIAHTDTPGDEAKSAGEDRTGQAHTEKAIKQSEKEQKVKAKDAEIKAAEENVAMLEEQEKADKGHTSKLKRDVKEVGEAKKKVIDLKEDKATLEGHAASDSGAKALVDKQVADKEKELRHQHAHGKGIHMEPIDAKATTAAADKADPNKIHGASMAEGHDAMAEALKPRGNPLDKAAAKHEKAADDHTQAAKGIEDAAQKLSSSAGQYGQAIAALTEAAGNIKDQSDAIARLQQQVDALSSGQASSV